MQTAAGMAQLGMATAPATPALCAHCGAPCPDRRHRANDRLFCCAGCQTVFGLLHAHGLDRFYTLETAPGVRPPAPGAYDHLDAPDIRRGLIDFSDGRTARVTLRLPAMHCAACVWLLENLYRLEPAIGASRVHFPRREISLQFDESKIKLSRVARLLAGLGYPPELNLGSLDAPAADRAGRALLLRLGIAGFAFGNIMLLSFPAYLGLDPSADAALMRTFGLLSIALALPVLLYSAADYWRAAWRCLRGRFLTIEFPIALGLLALFTQSAVEITAGASEGYLDSFAGLVFLLLCGRWFQHKTYAGMSFERDYKAFFPLAALRRGCGGDHAVPVTTLAVGDRILVRHQELIPADAVVRAGAPCVDYSFVTGEAEPVRPAPGATLYAGGKQVGGALELEIIKPVSQGYLASLWNHEAFHKTREQPLRTLTNRAGRIFTYAVIAIAAGTTLAWWWLDPTRALRAGTAVLLVACPCALALTAPFVLGTAQRLLGRHRLFLRNSDVVETLGRLDTVVFDKTGTLTQGALQVTDVLPLSPPPEALEEDALLSLAAGAEEHYSHPVAAAVVAAARSRGLKSPEMSQVDFVVAHGVSAYVQGARSTAFLQRMGLVPGRLISLESVRPAPSCGPRSTEQNVLQTQSGLRLHLRPDQEEDVMVEVR